MMRIWTLSVALSLALCAVVLVGCGDESDASPSGNGSGSGSGSGGGGSCATPNAGCACEPEGQLVQCGEVAGTTAAGKPDCEFGYRRCESGVWSKCEQLQNLTGQNAQGGVHVLGGAPPVVLTTDAGCDDGGDPCDPYCMGFPTGTLPDGGITGTQSSEGGTGSMGLGVLAEAGVDVDAGIFHVLSPGQIAINPINVTTTLNPVDVYFLFNSTNEMYSSFEALASQMPSVVSTVEVSIPNTAFGLGRFTNYASWPYQTQAAANTVYAPILGETTNPATINAAFGSVNAGEFTSKPYVVAQSSGVALYSMALNEDLGSWAGFPSYYSPTPGADYWFATTKWWGRGPLSNWYGNFYQSYNGCTAGTLGAACFRQNAFHLVILLQDSPMMNGPVGSFPYYQFMPRYFPNNSWADYTTENSWYWWDVQAPILGGTAGAPVQTEAVPAATVGQPQTWMGSAFNNASNYEITAAGIVNGGAPIPYDASATMKCTWNGQNLGDGPDAEFDFTVTAASQRYWFDTVGSAYDTVLYLVDKSTNTVMACSDDNFAWLSEGGLGVPGDQIAQYNSAIAGTLPPGNYELVLDQNAASGWYGFEVNPAFYTGYQVNMWPDMTDPKVSGPGTAQVHSSEASTPGYNQTLAALATPGINAKVGAIEMSGVTCGQSATAWENNFTRWSMEGIATDTGALASGQPIVISVKQDGTPGPASGSDPRCPSAASLGAVVTTAIAELTNNQAQAITASVVDFDDLTDYDGPPGGPVLYTPYNVDDATFVSSIVAQPVAGCTVDPTATFYTSCSPGSLPNFQFTFAVPTSPVAVVPSSVDQIFYFKIYLYGSANLLTPLVTVPVVIIVPAPPYVSVDYYEDYGAVCPAGTAPVWGIFNWSSTTPKDSAIDFLAAFGSTVADVNAATDISPPFETAQKGPPDTEIGAFDLGQYAKTNNVATNDGYVRIHARLRPSMDGTVSPTLTNMNLQVDCVPSE
ncbi:MAG TPA: hypothetical protein VIJ22_14625 [Polyangiaceae bacterium]